MNTKRTILKLRDINPGLLRRIMWYASRRREAEEMGQSESRERFEGIIKGMLETLVWTGHITDVEKRIAFLWFATDLYNERETLDLVA